MIRIAIFALIYFVILPALAQQKQKWFLEAAIRATGDAEMYFIGSSWSAGVGGHVAKKWTVSAAYTYFSLGKTKPGMPQQKYQTHTVDVLANYNFMNLFKSNKGWYAGGGVAWQSRYEEYFQSADFIHERKRYFTSVYNVGYRFPITLNGKPRSISVDLKATGGYREENYWEVLTQVMMGVRFRY
jgi:outer membrane receptor for ferric coprogen and ferric-rhodotorulic acid